MNFWAAEWNIELTSTKELIYGILIDQEVTDDA